MRRNKKGILSTLFLLITITLCWGMASKVEAKSLNDYLKEGLEAYYSARYNEALRAWEAGLKQAEEQGHEGWQGAFLADIGVIHRDLGRYEKALEYYRKALAIHKKIGDVQGMGADLTNIGVVYRSLGHFEKALEYYGKALAIRKKIADRKGVGNNLINIGVIHRFLGRHEKALEYYQKALAIHREIGDTRGEGYAFSNISVIYYDLGRYEKALKYYQKALAIHKNIGDVQGAGDDLTNIGVIYRDLGRHEKALEYYRMALAIHRKIGDIRGEGNDLTNIGIIYDDLGRYEKALERHKKALAISRKIEDIQAEGNALNNMGCAFLHVGDLLKAERRLQSAADVYESVRGEIRTGRERTGFQSTLPDVYGNLAAARLARGNFKGAFEAVERGRAKSFLDLLGTRRTGKGRRGRKTAGIEEMERRLVGLREKRVKLASAPAGAKTRSSKAAVDKKISELDRQRLKLIEKLRRADPELGSLSVVAPPSLGEIQSLLTPGTSIVEYFHKGEHNVFGKKRNQLWVFVVRKDGLDLKAVDVKRKELKAAINRYAKLLADAASDKVAVDRTRARLYAWLIQPVEHHINHNTVIIVPWGPMFKIPFATLAPKGGEPLGARKNVVMAPSAGVYQFLVDKRLSGSGRICAIGNPKTAMTPLPGAEKEAKEIAALFKASTVRTGARATESLMKGGYDKLDRPDVIHFACHGIFNEKTPELSHLALTPDQKNDGKLEMHEIFDLDWKGVSLVTMSACSSGKGKLGAGDDLMGLMRGFMFAGAPSILCSLWDVDDEATRGLMVKFYKNYLNGMSKPESLRRAQVAMMINPKWSHPYYWSAFVLFGDWM